MTKREAWIYLLPSRIQGEVAPSLIAFRSKDEALKYYEMFDKDRPMLAVVKVYEWEEE